MNVSSNAHLNYVPQKYAVQVTRITCPLIFQVQSFKYYLQTVDHLMQCTLKIMSFSFCKALRKEFYPPTQFQAAHVSTCATLHTTLRKMLSPLSENVWDDRPANGRVTTKNLRATHCAIVGGLEEKRRISDSHNMLSLLQRNFLSKKVMSVSHKLSKIVFSDETMPCCDLVKKV